MHNAYMTIEEIMAWLDAFSETTGLSCSQSTIVLTGLLGFDEASHLFAETADRQMRYQHLRENDLDDDADSLLASLREIRDENLCDEHVAERFQHYRMVLKHHGFDEGFYDHFRRFLSPSSQEASSFSSFPQKGLFSGSFNGTPMPIDEVEDDFADDEDDDEIPDPLELLNAIRRPGFMEMIRMSRPVNPIGWRMMLEHLGFETVDVKESHGEPWFPKFYALKDAIRHPVFVVGPTKSLFDEEDEQANEIMELIQRENTLMAEDVPFIFWSNPGFMGPDKLGYWGEFRVKGIWRPLFLSDSVSTLGLIQEVATHIEKRSDSGYDLAAAKLADRELALYKVFEAHHVDPVEKMMEEVMSRRRE